MLESSQETLQAQQVVAPKGGGRGGKKAEKAEAQIEGPANGVDAVSPKGETAGSGVRRYL